MLEKGIQSLPVHLLVLGDFVNDLLLQEAMCEIGLLVVEWAQE